MRYVRPAGRASSSFAFVHVAKCSRLVVPLRSSLGICPIERAYHSTSVRLRQTERPTRLSTFSHDDTIYAVSTGSGRAGIAIVRISGHSCLEVYRAICPDKRTPRPRFAVLRTLFDPSSLSCRSILDSDALVLYFPAPRTVTGEDVLELHIHGGPATVKAVLGAIQRCPSSSVIRFAEPGEFTRRAFQNNRLDLAQVEALSDTLSAETEQQRLAAVRGTFGALGRRYEAWRHRLLYARGELEALIDFSEDQHFEESPVELLRSVSSQVSGISNSITSHIKASCRGELLRKGIRISLLGPPNAGKSSLLNRIVGREASIVSQEAGTTRDIVEVSLDIRGYLCTFADTAGLRQISATTPANNPKEYPFVGDIEKEGIRRAKLKAAESDVVIVLTSVESADGKNFEICYDQESLKIAAKAQASLVLINKIDKVQDHHHLLDMKNIFCKQVFPSLDDNERARCIVPISCRSEDFTGNIEGFLDLLTSRFQDLTSPPVGEEDLLGVTERQRQLLSTCLQHLIDFVRQASMDSDDCDIVLAAEHLRAAANCLARITGRGEAGDVEEVLGVVFEKCATTHSLF